MRIALGVFVLWLASLPESSPVRHSIQFGPGVSDIGATLDVSYEKYSSYHFVGLKIKGEAEVNLIPIRPKKLPLERKYSIEIPIGIHAIFRYAILKANLGLKYSTYVERGELLETRCSSNTYVDRCEYQYARRNVGALGVPADMKIGLRFKNVGLVWGPSYDFTSHSGGRGGNINLWIGF